MKLVGAAELLNAWEAGLSQPPLRRALVLLSAAVPGTSPETLAAMTVGQRDRRLLQLREDLFGLRLQNVAVCPDCGERIEWENHTAEFLGQADLSEAADEAFELEAGDYAVRFRLPSSLDVAAVADVAAIGQAERLLLSRCLLDARRAGEPCPFDSLPDEVMREVGDRLEQLDPLGDLRIGLQCPECRHEWEVVFDIASFLWKEVDDWASRTLGTVSALAQAFGWSENQILRLSPLRRQLYLGLIGG